MYRPKKPVAPNTVAVCPPKADLDFSQHAYAMCLYRFHPPTALYPDNWPPCAGYGDILKPSVDLLGAVVAGIRF